MIDKAITDGDAETSHLRFKGQKVKFFPELFLDLESTLNYFLNTFLLVVHVSWV